MTTKNPKTNYYLEDDPNFKDFIIERNLSESSIKNYKLALNSYCEFNKMTITELLDEADQDEENRVRPKKRMITKRLTSYRRHLLERDVKPNTLNNYMVKIKTFFRHNMIEIPYMNPLKLPQKQVMYEDIPHKEHVRELLEHCHNLKHKAIIYFLAATGSARQEVSNLTINDFIEATKDYHNNTSNVEDIIKQLESQDDIIPLWKMTRQKTGYKYYTVSTPESTTNIIRYLKTRSSETLTPESKLFMISPVGISKFLNRLTKNMNYPFRDGVAFFHPHSFRKYHADLINNNYLANMLQGRKPDSITESYFKANPERIKFEYTKHIKDLTLAEVNVVTVESDEVKQLKKVLDVEKSKNEELQKRVDNIESEAGVLGRRLDELINNFEE